MYPRWFNWIFKIDAPVAISIPRSMHRGQFPFQDRCTGGNSHSKIDALYGVECIDFGQSRRTMFSVIGVVGQAIFVHWLLWWDEKKSQCTGRGRVHWLSYFLDYGFYFEIGYPKKIKPWLPKARFSMHCPGGSALTFFQGPNIKSMHFLGLPEVIYQQQHWFNQKVKVNMVSKEGNPFLRQARAMSFDTPEKQEKPPNPNVKSEDNGKEEKLEDPSPSLPKKLCTSHEKFLKKLPGDTSTMREPLPWWGRVIGRWENSALCFRYTIILYLALSR